MATEKRHNIVQRMIAADCVDIADALFSFSTNAQAIVSLGLMPYLCLIINEAYDWCVKSGIKLPPFKSKGTLEKIRAKAKLFSGDNRLSFAEQSKAFEMEVAIQHQYFKSLAKSFAPDFMIDDVGVYQINNVSIGNTIQYAGDFRAFSKGDCSIFQSGQELKDFATEVGSALQAVVTLLSGKCYKIKSPSKKLDIKNFDYQFKRKFKTLPVLISYSLKCRINFLMIALKPTIRENSLLYVRLLYITFFSLKEDLLNLGLNCGDVFDTQYDCVFRNCMAHYSLYNKMSDNEINEDIIGFGIIEKYFGLDFAELVEVLESKLCNILQSLSSLCSFE